MLTDSHSRTASLSQRDRSTAVMIGVLLVFQGWNFAGFRVPVELGNLILASLSLMLGFVPLKDPLSSKPIDNLKRLLRFPIFWLGLLFLLYIIIQACNPAWMYFKGENGKWNLYSQEHISFLPTGINSPFMQTNPWRELLVKSPFWITACALWVGVRRVRVCNALLWLIAINVVFVTCFGVIYSYAAPHKFYFGILGDHYFLPTFGAFINRTHASMFIYISLAATVFLLLTHITRTKRNNPQGKDNSPVAFLVVIALIPAFGAITTLSRAGMVASFAMLTLGILLMALQSRSIKHWAVIIMFLILAWAAGHKLYQSETFTNLYEKFTQAESRGDLSIRSAVSKDTISMFKEKPVYGWGAGSFRYLFPAYQLQREKVRLGFWRFAHNDYAQHLAEYGIIGGALWFAILMNWVYMAGMAAWLKPGRGLIAVLVLGLVGIHAYLDYPLHTPSVVITLSTVIYLIYTSIREQSLRKVHS